MVAELELYNRITDTILWFGSNCVMKMYVSLYSNSEKYGRKYYYREVETNFTGIRSRKINRDFDAHLSIENTKATPDGLKTFIPIREGDLEILRMSVVPYIEYWIYHKADIFEPRSDGKIYKRDIPANITQGTKEYDDWIHAHGPITISLSSRNSLTFEPALIHSFNSEGVDMGVCMFLNSNRKNPVGMSIQKALAFNRIVREFNISLYASSMLSYIGRPKLGTNLFVMGGGHRTRSPFDVNKEDADSQGYFSIINNNKK